MPAVTRLGVDPSAGHCFSPRPPDSASPNVFSNSIAQVRITDHYPTHCCGDPCHDGTASAGSATVFVNNLNIHRIGDAISCGDVSANGSPNVFAGDSSVIAISIEPGVFSLAGMPVYDATPEGQAASIRSEKAHSPSMPGNPVTGDTPPEPVPGEVPPAPVDCGSFNEPITMEDMNKGVSTNFKLSHCKEMPVAQRGLKSSQIACNWKALCTNILDHVKAAGFNFSFNSGFRNAARDSGGDHGIGCAADISMPTTAQTIAMFKWLVHSGLPFTQIIYEKHNSAWVHVSFNGKSPKGVARVMWTYTGSAPYGMGGQNGQNLPAELA